MKQTNKQKKSLKTILIILQILQVEMKVKSRNKMYVMRNKVMPVTKSIIIFICFKGSNFKR